LEHLSGDVAGRILTKIETLAGNPRPVGVIKLRGQKISGGSASLVIAWFIRLLIFPGPLMFQSFAIVGMFIGICEPQSFLGVFVPSWLNFPHSQTIGRN
jgi:hypothetical protein